MPVVGFLLLVALAVIDGNEELRRIPEVRYSIMFNCYHVDVGVAFEPV